MLLQPGSLIFFIGSKNNFKLFSKLTNMKQYVKCVYGPQKVTLDNLPIDEHLSNIIGVKPYNSGHAQFVVWQKKNKFFENTGDEQDDSDAMSDLCPSSESSFASFVENGDKSKCDLESSDNFYSSLEKKISGNKPYSLSLGVNSVENITSALSNIKLNHANCGEQKLQASEQDIFQPSCDNASNLVIETNHSLIENKLSVVRDNQVVEETVKNNIISLKNAELVSTDNKVSPANLINEEAIIQSTPTKKSKKKKAQSVNKTEDQSLNENTKKDNCEHPKTLQSSCKNSVKFEKEVITPQATNVEALNYTDNSVQSLLQQCGSLISKLEELTDDIKNGFNSSGKGQIFNKTHFCSQQTQNCHAFHHNCCVKIVHSCCCRKFCKH